MIHVKMMFRSRRLSEPFSEVPPSDQGSAANAKRADKSGKKREGENLTEWERISLELGRKPVFDYDKTLPSYDGFLNSDLFGRKIPFHYIQINAWAVRC